MFPVTCFRAKKMHEIVSSEKPYDATISVQRARIRLTAVGILTKLLGYRTASIQHADPYIS